MAKTQAEQGADTQRADAWDATTDPVVASYASARTQVLGGAGSKGFGDVLKPLDDAVALTQKKRAAMATMREEHRAGRLANDQVPVLTQRMTADARTAVDAAVKVSGERIAHLQANLEAEAFRAPMRGAHSAEAKADIERALQARPDAAQALVELADRAVQNRDPLVLSLLVSDFGVDLAHASGVGGVVPMVRARAITNPDIFGLEPGTPGTLGKDNTSPRVPALKGLAGLDDLEHARVLGLHVADMAAQGLERGIE